MRPECGKLENMAASNYCRGSPPAGQRGLRQKANHVGLVVCVVVPAEYSQNMRGEVGTGQTEVRPEVRLQCSEASRSRGLVCAFFVMHCLIAPVPDDGREGLR